MGPCTLWWPLKARATVLLGALALLAPAVASGEIYSCRKPQGEIGFQDRPCAAGSTSTLLKQDEEGVSKTGHGARDRPQRGAATRTRARPAGTDLRSRHVAAGK